MDINTIKQYYNHSIRKMTATANGLKALYRAGQLSAEEFAEEMIKNSDLFEQRTEHFIDSFPKKKRAQIRKEIHEFAESINMPLATAL